MTCKIVQGYVITPIELGKGCFGTVYRGYVKDNKNQLLAVKAIPLETIKNDEVVRREIEILLKLKSPNIVKFYKPAKTAKHLYFFLEYCQQDLKNYVKSKGGKLSESEVQNILMQICKGFEVVQSNNIIHRDIKPANFLIHDGVVKISDFGFARVVDDLEQPLFLTFLGSPLYMAPQILAKQKFSSKCDVWSLGVTIYEFLYGKTPWTAQNPKQLLQNIRNKPLIFPENIARSQEIKSLLKQMLTIDEQKRISMLELINHDYIKAEEKEIEKENSSEDSLWKSFASNNTHLTRNKVLTQTSVSPSISQVSSKKEEKAEKENDFNKELKEQNQQIDQYLKIEQVDELMRYKRNVSVFLNVQCNNFFSNASDLLSEYLFHLGLFILLNQQIQIHHQLKHQLIFAKPPLKQLSPEIWYSYQKSTCFLRIMKLLESDLKHLESYFYEVRNRVNVALKSNANKLKYPEISKDFQKYYELSKENKHHEEYYQDIVRLLVAQLKKNQKKIGDKRFISKLLMTIKPFKYLNQKLDFGLFYERENEQVDKLVEEFPELS